MKGVLLINLGTPEAPTTQAVRTYLREFLSDPCVIDIHPMARWLLLNAIILPFRPKKSAAAYQKIWTPEGSPLRIHSEALTEAVQIRLGEEYNVRLAMRYGQPTIADELNNLMSSGATQIVVVPLYPQYATSSTGTALNSVYKAAIGRAVVPVLNVVPDYYDHPQFIDTVASMIQADKAEFKADHVLFSYHGLPERHIRQCDFSGDHCLVSDDCCDTIQVANRSCYRAQCFATTRAIVEKLQLSSTEWSIGFQSRLGRTPWIKPYTDEIIPKLVESGVRRLIVSCPSFVSDCLETLEEIGMRAKEEFIDAGGEDLHLVPAVNSHEKWVDAIASMVSTGLDDQSGTPSTATP
jgi:ferrochelatase